MINLTVRTRRSNTLLFPYLRDVLNYLLSSVIDKYGICKHKINYREYFLTFPYLGKMLELVFTIP